MWDGRSEPPELLKPEVDAASITMFVDTNIIGEPMQSIQFLWRCRKEGWVRLQRTDVIETEYETLPSEFEFKRDIAGQLAESLTPFVLDHSRLDSAVLASGDDEERILTAFRILHPNADFRNTRKNNVRDAMTLAGSARYGGDYLVTRDDNIIKKSDALHDALAIRCLHPDVMADVVVSAIQRTVKNQPLTGWPRWMPAWRPYSWEEELPDAATGETRTGE